MIISKKQLLLMMIYGFSLLTMFNIQTMNTNTLDDNSEDSIKIDREELNLDENINHQEVFEENSKLLEKNNDYKKGKSVKVEQNLLVDYLDHQETRFIVSEGDDYYEKCLSYAYLDDELFYNFNVSDSNNDKYIRVEFHFAIFTHCKGGTIESDRQFNILWKNGTENTHFLTQASLKIEGGYSNTGFLYICGVFEMTDEENSVVSYYVRNGELIQIESDSNNYAKEEFEWVIAYVDFITFTQSEATTYLRSEYKYLSETLIEHKITDYLSEYGQIKFYYTPKSWNFSHSFPEGYIFYNSTLKVWQVSKSCFIGNIELYFFEGEGYGVDYPRQNQFLCIDKVASFDFEDKIIDTHDLVISQSEYLNTYEFITGYFSNDYKPESSINSSIVSKGEFSTEINAHLYSGTYYAYISIHVPYSQLYLSLDHYLKTSDGSISEFGISYRKDSTWITSTPLNQIENIWHTSFSFVDCVETYYTQILIYLEDNSDFTLYLDNINLFKANPSLVTTKYGKQEFTTTLRSWDNLENPILTNEEITCNIRIRHNSTLLESFTLTNTNTYQTSFENYQLLNELELEAYSKNSWFGCKSYEYFEDLAYFGGSATDWSESLSSDSITGDQSLQGEWSGSGKYWWLNPTSDFDISNCDYLIFDMKTNLSSISTNDIYQVLYRSGSADYWRYNPDFNYYDSWTEFLFTLDYGSDWSEVGIPDLTQLDYFQLYFSYSVSIQITLNLDSLRFIQAQKSYLTPSNVEYNVNYKYESNNIFDFTEGYNEGSWSGIDGVTIENGYLTGVCASGASDVLTMGTYSGSGIFNIDTSIYDYIIITAKSNVSDLKYIPQGYMTAGSKNIGAWQTLTTSYTRTIITPSSDWTGTCYSIRLALDEDGGDGNLEGNEGIWIDSIEFVKKDTVSLFETDSYFYTLSTNNTLQSYITSDNNLLNPESIDLEINILNNSIGQHQLNYTIYNDLDISDCYIPSETYSYNYNIVNQTLLVMNYLDLLEIHIDTSFTNVMSSLSSLSNQLNTNITTIINMINALDSVVDSYYSNIIGWLEYIVDQNDLNEGYLLDIITDLTYVLSNISDMQTDLTNILNSFDTYFDNLEDTLLAETNEIDATLTTIINSLDLLDSNLANNFTNIMTSLSNIYSNQDNFSIIITNINNLSSQLNSNTTTILNAISNLQSIHLANMTTLVNNILSLSNQLNINTTTLLNAINDLNVTQQFIYNLQFDQSFNETVREFNMTSPMIVKTENSFFVDITIWNNYTGSDITIIWQNNLGEIVKSEYLGKAIITNNSLLLSINALEIEGNYTITIMLTNEYLVAFSQSSITLQYNLSKANSDIDNFFALGSFLLILLVIFLLVRKFYKNF